MEQKELWMNLVFFLSVFLIVFIITYITNLNKLKKKKENTISELRYLILKFRLKKEKLAVRKMLLWFSIMNAFIISFVATFITAIEIGTIWQMLIGFILLFGLIYSFYEIYGRHLVNQEKRKEEKKDV